MIRCTTLYLLHKNILRKNIKEIYHIWTMLHAQLPEAGIMYGQYFPGVSFLPVPSSFLPSYFHPGRTYAASSPEAGIRGFTFPWD